MAKTVLITGVSSGIGKMTAELMAKRGWQVAATTRNPDAVSIWASENRIFTVSIDLASEDAIASAVTAVSNRFGGIDVLVNNAGYGVFGPLEGTSAEEIETQFRVNVLAVVSLTRHIMAVMREHGGGTIINVSSVAGRLAAPFASLYHASKYAIEGFSESIRFEASLHGVRVKVIEPSHFRTGFIERGLSRTRHPAYDERFDNYMEWVLEEDRRAPTAEPVAEAILKAAEDDSPRLRYPVKGSLILALKALLPDKVWFSLLAGGMTRRLKRPANR